jgi:N-acetyl sugar amidotransferase
MMCSFCVMDDTASEFVISRSGCCFCDSAKRRIESEVSVGSAKAIAENIRTRTKTKKFDCVIGVSGGVDSSYVALTVRKLGLRPLAVHVDNGWNSALATQNISKLLDSLEIPLMTEVLDWSAFRDLQNSFLRAGIANAEIPTDHVILSILLRYAAKNSLKYIITGSNVRTEAIMPASWMSHAIDFRLIKHVGEGVALSRLPLMPLRKFGWDLFVKGMKLLPILNYVDYDRNRAMEELSELSGWIPYEAKHHESVFTRWFQTQYLPTRFNIDKRKPHLSSLIASGQITREEAVQELASLLITPRLAADDLNLVSRKLQMEISELEALMKKPPGSIDSFKNSEFAFRRLDSLSSALRRRALSPGID